MNDFNFSIDDLDAILAEFGVSAQKIEESREKTTEFPETFPKEISLEVADETNTARDMRDDSRFTESQEELRPIEPRHRNQPRSKREQKEVQKNIENPEFVSPRQKNYRKPENNGRQLSDNSAEEKQIRKRKKMPDRDEILDTAGSMARKSVSGLKKFVLTFTGLVFGTASLLILAWMLVNVHPDSAMASSQLTAKKRADIVSRLDAYSNNMKGSLLGDLAYIRKQYKIPEGDLVAPMAPSYNYGTTTDPQEVLAVIDEARGYGLLDDQNVIFNEHADFYYDSNIQYYCDETLLVICWKELIDNRIVSCVEVKVADGSQFRRKLAEDTYGSSQYVYATELAAQSNAVAAMNADYYAFRDLGITVYDRRLYRFDDGTYNGAFEKYNATDTLFVNGDGDFLVFHQGDTATREEMERFIADNNIIFAIAFGPILVEDGEQKWCDWYPIGEVDKEYSRAGIAQYDKLHYLYMTVSFADREGEYHPRCTINEFSEIMAGKNVRLGYCLDGGQTGEIVFNGKPYNHIDFGTERTVSDIIYFASAIPESER